MNEHMTEEEWQEYCQELNEYYMQQEEQWRDENDR